MPLIKESDITEQMLEMVETMGGTGFTPAEIAEVLEMEESDFMGLFNDKGSAVYKRFRKGYLLSQLTLRQRIFKDAGFGSSPAQTLAKKIMDDLKFQLDDQ